MGCMVQTVLLLILWWNRIESTSVCPGGTTKSTTTPATTTLDPNRCNDCSVLFALEWNSYLLGGKDVCILDALEVTTCFEQCRGEDLFFYLIGTASDYLYDYNDIDTDTWTNYQDVMDTYYEKCPNATRPSTTTENPLQTTEPAVAYFLNLDNSINIGSSMNVEETVYIIETNDDSASLSYGIVMNTNSTHFQLNSSNELQLLVKSSLVAGVNFTLEFDIDYQHSCGPGTLFISVTDTALLSTAGSIGTTTVNKVGNNNGNDFLDDSRNVALVSSGVGLSAVSVAGASLYWMTKKKGCRRQKVEEEI